MLKELVPTDIQIFVLDIEVKIRIKEMLESELKKTFEGNELDEYIENGLDSRLCDLADTIDIYNIEGLHIIC